MFASQQGPWGSKALLLDNGDSYVSISGLVTTYSLSNQSSPIAFTVFGKDRDKEMMATSGGTWMLVDVCETLASEEDFASSNLWAVGIKRFVFDSSYVGTISSSDSLVQYLNMTSDDNYSDAADDDYVVNNDPTSGHNIRAAVRLQGNQTSDANVYYIWRSWVEQSVAVNDQAWFAAVVQSCGASTVYSTVLGDAAFRNPYGFIPAEYYGMLPFEAGRLVALVSLFLVFLVYCVRYGDKLLPLHYAILVACFVAVIDGSVAMDAYFNINRTGQPDCCPFASPIVASLVVQIIRQTVSRILLLAVALGWGVARPTLAVAEWALIGGLGVAYLVTNMVTEMSEVKFEKSNPYGVPATDAYLSVELVAALFCDVVFMTWIFSSLSATMNSLAERKQTYKLQLYANLTNIVISFTAVFIVSLVVLSIGVDGLLGTPWQFSWLGLVIWEVLNFSVLVAICIICLPNENSQMLSYASQLPTSEDDDIMEDGRLDANNDMDNEDLILPRVQSAVQPLSGTERRFDSAATHNPIVMKLNNTRPPAARLPTKATGAVMGSGSGRVGDFATSVESGSDDDFADFESLPPPSSK
jgi:hypothetical protein